MDHVDKKYINLLSPKLRNFKWKSPTLANFSCPICGDSQRNKKKARGFVFPHKTKSMFKCHNCSKSLPLSKLLESVDPLLYGDYCFDKFKKRPNTIAVQTAEKKLKRFSTPLVLTKHVVKLTTLKDSHPCKQYVIKRQIPESQFERLYYAENFRDWVVQFKPEKKDSLNNEPRLILPFFDRSGKHVIGFQGRSLAKNSVQRYVSIRLEENTDFLFGMESLNWTKDIIVVEGPIDSLFLDNCCAMATAGKKLPFKPELVTMAYDNERRNKQITDFMEKSLDMGYKVCFWPKSIKQKDVNDMILKGMTKEQVMLTIQTNSYSGLRGHLELSNWRQ